MPTPATLLFPPTPREFPGQRWANIILRTLHLVGIAGIGGGFLLGADAALWQPFWYLAVATGASLVLLYLASSAIWVCQLRGLAILAKLALLTAALRWPAWQGPLFITVIAISGLIAHAPSRVRGLLLLPTPRSGGRWSDCR